LFVTIGVVYATPISCFVEFILSFSQSDYLTILTHAPAEAVKAFAETILPEVATVTVLQNRTGLVMLPYTDTSKGTLFHLGEVLVAEAHVRIESGVEGYAACVGRDLVQALAVALLDAALTAGIQCEAIEAFLTEQQTQQRETDDQLLRQVEATRVEMETF
jgi:alpha-D-ribose 1-methylphosphonate 5-triphosphate synthase subunit PhnG